MTPNKVEHFQEWLKQFKPKVVIPASKLPKESDYSIAYKVNGYEFFPPRNEVYAINVSVPISDDLAESANISTSESVIKNWVNNAKEDSNTSEQEY